MATSITLSEFHTFSPNLTNEFRAGFNRYFSNDPAGNFNFPGLDMFPNINVFDLGGNWVPIPTRRSSAIRTPTS